MVVDGFVNAESHFLLVRGFNKLKQGTKPQLVADHPCYQSGTSVKSDNHRCFRLVTLFDVPVAGPVCGSCRPGVAGRTSGIF